MKGNGGEVIWNEPGGAGGFLNRCYSRVTPQKAVGKQIVCVTLCVCGCFTVFVLSYPLGAGSDLSLPARGKKRGRSLRDKCWVVKMTVCVHECVLTEQTLQVHQLRHRDACNRYSYLEWNRGVQGNHAIMWSSKKKCKADWQVLYALSTVVTRLTENLSSQLCLRHHQASVEGSDTLLSSVWLVYHCRPWNLCKLNDQRGDISSSVARPITKKEKKKKNTLIFFFLFHNCQKQSVFFYSICFMN